MSHILQAIAVTQKQMAPLLKNIEHAQREVEKVTQPVGLVAAMGSIRTVEQATKMSAVVIINSPFANKLAFQQNDLAKIIESVEAVVPRFTPVELRPSLLK